MTSQFLPCRHNLPHAFTLRGDPRRTTTQLALPNKGLNPAGLAAPRLAEASPASGG